MTKWRIYPRSGQPESDSEFPSGDGYSYQQEYGDGWGFGDGISDSLGVGHAGDAKGNGYTPGYDYGELVTKVRRSGG